MVFAKFLNRVFPALASKCTPSHTDSFFCCNTHSLMYGILSKIFISPLLNSSDIPFSKHPPPHTHTHLKTSISLSFPTTNIHPPPPSGVWIWFSSLCSLQKEIFTFCQELLTLLRMRAGHLLLARLCIRGTLKGGGESGALKGGIRGMQGSSKGHQVSKGVLGVLSTQGGKILTGASGVPYSQW